MRKFVGELLDDHDRDKFNYPNAFNQLNNSEFINKKNLNNSVLLSSRKWILLRLSQTLMNYYFFSAEKTLMSFYHISAVFVVKISLKYIIYSALTTYKYITIMYMELVCTILVATGHLKFLLFWGFTIPEENGIVIAFVFLATQIETNRTCRCRVLKMQINYLFMACRSDYIYIIPFKRKN